MGSDDPACSEDDAEVEAGCSEDDAEVEAGSSEDNAEAANRSLRALFPGLWWRLLEDAAAEAAGKAVGLRGASGGGWAAWAPTLSLREGLGGMAPTR